MAPLSLGPMKAALAGRYAVERELGQGGMAVVLLARDERHGRPVALKLLRPELAAHLGTDRFLREIEIAARLAHPNILPLLDSGVVRLEDGHETPFYVMPLVEGESLRERLSHGPLQAEEAIRLLVEVADALDCAHRQGIIHRDIKPDNILLQQGHAVVSDFGIARAVSAATGVARLTETGMSLGTRGYMSPEQMAGLEVDQRSDIYSLGCLAMEMLTGQPPMPGASGAIRLEPATLRSAIAKALAVPPADRWNTAAEFAAALRGSAVTARSRMVPMTVGVATTVGLIAIALLVNPGTRGGHPDRDPATESVIQRARELIADGSAPHVIEAVRSLQDVARRDSTNTRAWTGLATAYIWSERHGIPLPEVPAESLGPLALRFSERALRIDSLDSDAWLARGWVDEYLDPARKVVALEAYRRAIVIDSTNAEAWARLGTVLEDLNSRGDALAAYRRAAAIDPERHAYKVPMHFFFDRRLDSAVIWSDSIVAIAPGRYWSRFVAGAVALAAGDRASAEIHFTAARRLESGAEVAGTAGLAQVMALRGDTARARQLIAEAVQKTDQRRPALHNPVYIALALLSLGDRDQALAWLERYELVGDLHYQVHLNREPGLDGLRQLPRFQRLLRPLPK
jgi:serine/threonine protein kinase